MRRSFGQTILAVLGGCIVAATAWAAEPVGRVLTVEGKPVVQRQGTAKVVLKRNDPIYLGDVIETGRGRVKLIFEDQSLMTLDRNTKLRITEFLYKPRQRKRSSFFDLIEGKVKALVGQLFSEVPDFRIRTRSAVAGVRGTYFMVESAGDRAAVTVFEGQVEVAPAGGGTPQLLGAGMQIKVGTRGPIGAPKKLPRRLLRRLEKEVEVRAQGELQRQTAARVDHRALILEATARVQRRGPARRVRRPETPAAPEVEEPQLPTAAPPINLESVDPSQLGQVRLKLKWPEVR